jgi:hypothetical protein
LNQHVASDPSPYKRVIEAVRFGRGRGIDDDVAEKFTEAQSSAQLEEFAGTPSGLEMLEVLHGAMTDDIQSARIVYAKWRWNGAGVYKAARLTDPELHSPWDRGVTIQAAKIAATLTQDIARKNYDGVIKKVRQDSSIEDDIASRVTSLLSPQRLDELAVDQKGGAILDVLYDALITGSITAFEKLQADRILDAKKKAISPQSYLAGTKRGKIFPLSDRIFEQTATFTAALRGGKVHVRYQTTGVYSDKFKQGRRALYGDLTKEDLVLDPSEVVQIKLYDEGGAIKQILAIELIDYAEQIQRRFEGRATTVVVAAATFGSGSLGGGGVRALAAAVEAGQASRVALAVSRMALWSDRAAFGLQIATAVAKNNRRWIVEKFGETGEAFLGVLEQANDYADFAGNLSMGIDAVRFFGSKLRPTWKKFREASPKKPLSEVEEKVHQGLREQVDNTLHAVDAGDAVAAVNKNPSRYRMGEEGGQRYTDLNDGHRIVEVRGKAGSGAGIGCEYHSNEPIPVPCTVNFHGGSRPGDPAAASTPIATPPGPDKLGHRPMDAKRRMGAAEAVVSLDKEVDDLASYQLRTERESMAARKAWAPEGGARRAPESLKNHPDYRKLPPLSNDELTISDRIEGLENLRQKLADSRRLTPEVDAHIQWEKQRLGVEVEVKGNKGAISAAERRKKQIETIERKAADAELRRASQTIKGLVTMRGPNFRAKTRTVSYDEVMGELAWRDLQKSQNRVTRVQSSSRRGTGVKTLVPLDTDHLVSLDTIANRPELNDFLKIYSSAPRHVQDQMAKRLSTLGDIDTNLVRMRWDFNEKVKGKRPWREITYNDVRGYYDAKTVDRMRARELTEETRLLSEIARLTNEFRGVTK